MSETQKNDTKSKTDDVSLEDVLANKPPGKVYTASEIFNVHKAEGYRSYFKLKAPKLKLYCDNDNCAGFRFFECDETIEVYERGKTEEFLQYECRNCKTTIKLFAITIVWMGDDNKFDVVKFGEWPPYGPITPPRLIKLVGPDKDMFLQGRRAESQGMGIGSFSYYRRIVENQKDRIFDQIIKVMKRIVAPEKDIEAVKSAKKKIQFTKAVESIKDAIPQVLLIKGHNPLILLHKALSKGLHAQSDEECLELATNIRVILTDLAERVGQILKDQAELDDAVKKLLK